MLTLACCTFTMFCCFKFETSFYHVMSKSLSLAILAYYNRLVNETNMFEHYTTNIKDGQHFLENIMKWVIKVCRNPFVGLSKKINSILQEKLQSGFMLSISFTSIKEER